MPKQLKRSKKSPKRQRRPRLTKEEQETAEKLGFLSPKDSLDNNADDNLGSFPLFYRNAIIRFRLSKVCFLAHYYLLFTP